MCLICLEFEKEKLSITEARRNLGEMAEGLGTHAVEVEDMIRERELETMIESYLDNDWGDYPPLDYEVWHGHGD